MTNHELETARETAVTPDELRTAERHLEMLTDMYDTACRRTNDDPYYQSDALAREHALKLACEAVKAHIESRKYVLGILRREQMSHAVPPRA